MAWLVTCVGYHDQFGNFYGIGSINTFVPQENRKSFKPEGTIIGFLQEAIYPVMFEERQNFP
jgi:hypothetical protein